MESSQSPGEQQSVSDCWRSCADPRLLAALPSLRILALRGPGSAVRLRASPAEPHLLRLEDGTETPGVGLIALRPGRTVVGPPGRLFAVDFDSTRGHVTAARLSEENELHVNGVEVLAGCGSSIPPHPLLPGSLIVSGRCLYQFCWSARWTTADSTRGCFLSGRAEVAGLRRENSDLAARARDLLESAGRAEDLAVRLSAALGRLEAALFAGAAGPQQPHRDQQNESCSYPVAVLNDTPVEATLLAKRCWPVEAESRHAVLLLAAPELQRAISVFAGLPASLSLSNARQLLQTSRSRRLQRRRVHCQLLMGVAADVSDKLVALLGGINANCGQAWLFDGLCNLVAEIAWAMSLVDC